MMHAAITPRVGSLVGRRVGVVDLNDQLEKNTSRSCYELMFPSYYHLVTFKKAIRSD